MSSSVTVKRNYSERGFSTSCAPMLQQCHCNHVPCWFTRLSCEVVTILPTVSRGDAYRFLLLREAKCHVTKGNRAICSRQTSTDCFLPLRWRRGWRRRCGTWPTAQRLHAGGRSRSAHGAALSDSQTSKEDHFTWRFTDWKGLRGTSQDRQV